MVELRSTSATASIDPVHGGRLASLRIRGHSLLWHEPAVTAPERDPMSWGSYPMAPFAGRVRRGRVRIGDTMHQLRINMPPHSIHGSVFDRAWDVVSSSTSHVELQTDLGEHWPAAGSCRQAFTLSDDGLRQTIEVTTAGTPFPASIGWHPWFRTRLDDGQVLDLQPRVGRQFLRDDEGLPSGRMIDPRPRPWDDCFTQVTWPIELDWSGALTLSIDSDCEYVVIYDEQPHAWCVEPQTAPPDALADRAHVVEVGRPLRATTTWSWESPTAAATS